MSGASSCADWGEGHLAWRISEDIFQCPAVDVRQVVVLSLGACYVERTSNLDGCRGRAPVAATCDRVMKLGILRQRLKMTSACVWWRSYEDGTCKGRGHGSSAGIATDYGLDRPGSNPGGDEIFRPSRPALGPTQPPVKWVPGLSRGQSAAGACCWPLTPF
jgi:hypothetical protein